MSVKCSVKRSQVYSSKSSSSSDVSTLPSSPTPPSLSSAFSPKDSPQGPPSIMVVYGVPPEGLSAVAPEIEDEEEDWEVLDTLRDEEITHKLFSDLNRDLLVMPSDSKVIVISDFKEEEHEDDHTNVNVVPSSLRVPPTPSTSATDDDGTPDQVQDDSNGHRSEDEADTP
jgi:hypothetical protein